VANSGELEHEEDEELEEEEGDVGERDADLEYRCGRW